MSRVLERLITPKALIYMIRRHGAEEFHGLNMEESDKVEFWLEKLQRIMEEVRCPLDQRVACAVSLLQGSAYDWWKPWIKISDISAEISDIGDNRNEISHEKSFEGKIAKKSKISPIFRLYIGIGPKFRRNFSEWNTRVVD